MPLATKQAPLSLEALRERTATHEVKHGLFAWAVGARVERIELFPHGGGQTLYKPVLAFPDVPEFFAVDATCTQYIVMTHMAVNWVGITGSDQPIGRHDSAELALWHQCWDALRQRHPDLPSATMLDTQAQTTVKTWLAAPPVHKAIRDISADLLRSGLLTRTGFKVAHLVHYPYPPGAFLPPIPKALPEPIFVPDYPAGASWRQSGQLYA